MEGLFSTKFDVYNFGVLLLEIVTGRKNSTYYQDSSSVNLVGNVNENVCCITFFFSFFIVS